MTALQGFEILFIVGIAFIAWAIIMDYLETRDAAVPMKPEELA